MVGARIGRWVDAAVMALTSLVTATFGWFAVWSAPVNGDEGYLLVSLREWVIRGGLYDRVFTQYGPFYYTLFGMPSRVFGIPWTIAAGRMTTLALWVVTAILFGVAVRSLTGNVGFGVAAQVLSFSMLASVLNEPMHPGALLCALLAALLANVTWLRCRAPVTSDGISGLLAAALMLTKVNVGIFAIVAIVFAFGQGARDRRWRWLSCAPLLALGPVLLLANGRELWRVQWASLYLVGAVAVVGVSRMHRGLGDLVRFRLGALTAGLVAGGVLFTGFVLARGSSATGLFRGVLIRPLEHPGLVTIPVRFPAISWLWLLAVPIGLLLWSRRRAVRAQRLAIALSGAARVVLGLTLMISVLGPAFRVAWDPDPSRFVMLPLVALVLVPRFSGVEIATLLAGRRLLGAAALTESLHAFPVPGSQVSWSVLTAGVAAVVIVADGISELVALDVTHAFPRAVRALGVAVCLLVVLVLPFGRNGGIRMPGAQFHQWLNVYNRQVPLGIAGTGRLRTPDWLAVSIRGLPPQVRSECDVSVTLGAPLYWFLLIDRRPATGYNHPAWPSYLDGREQRTNIAAIKSFDRICLLLTSVGGTVQGNHLTPSPFFSRSPLLRYLEARVWTPVGAALGVGLYRADAPP